MSGSGGMSNICQETLNSSLWDEVKNLELVALGCDICFASLCW